MPEPWHTPEPATHRYKWLLLTVIVVLTLAGVVAAFAHDAKPTAALPQGWSYPFTCCANYDCRQTKAGEISERADGYHTPSGEVVPYGDKRIKDSPDGEFHWCAHQAGLDAGKAICLFVPPRGY
ncbi:MAG: hypothetical protein E5W25_02955 [Mesorhizobium sp.]|nr:MAG: hypothetical protein E5W25_02955 [Mesorhizobium sp.]